jgi:hypothetical protein
MISKFSSSSWGLLPALLAPIMAIGLSGCVPSAMNANTQADATESITEVEQIEDLSWIPDGFSQWNDYIAFRFMDKDTFGCDGSEACIGIEVATSATCSVRLDIVTIDRSGRIVEELWDTAQIPVGAIGALQFPVSVTTDLERFEIVYGECYF